MALARGGALALLTTALAGPAPPWATAEQQAPSERRLQGDDLLANQYYRHVCLKPDDRCEDVRLEPCSNFDSSLCDGDGLVEDTKKRATENTDPQSFCLGAGDCLQDCIERQTEDCDESNGCEGLECGCPCDEIDDKEICCKPARCSTMGTTWYVGTIHCPSGSLIDAASTTYCLGATCTQADLSTCCKACDLCNGKYLLPNEYTFRSSAGEQTRYCPDVEQECTSRFASMNADISSDEFSVQCSACATGLGGFDVEACCSTHDKPDNFIPTRLFVVEKFNHEGEYHDGIDIPNKKMGKQYEYINDTFISLPTDCGPEMSHGYGIDSHLAQQDHYINIRNRETAQGLQECLAMCLNYWCCVAVRYIPYERENEGHCYIHNDCAMDKFFEHKQAFKDRVSFDSNDTLIGYPCNDWEDCTFFRTSITLAAWSSSSTRCTNDCPGWDDCSGCESDGTVELTESSHERRPRECTVEVRKQDWETMLAASQIILTVIIVGSCCCYCCCLGCCYWCWKKNRQQSGMKAAPPAAAPAAVPVAYATVVGAPAAVPVAPPMAVAVAVAAPVAVAAQVIHAVAVPVEAAPVEVTKRFCSECGQPITPGAAFCAGCGTKMQGAAPASSAPASAAPASAAPASAAPPTEPEA